MSINIYQRPSIPLQENPFQSGTRDYTSKAIAHGMDRTQFAAPWQQGDFPNVVTEQQFRYNVPELKKDVRPFVGQLPYTTTPKSYIDPGHRMIPESTQVSRVCFNEALDNSGPFYLRHWQIWDYAPFLPSNGDVGKDPRYGIQTKGFTTEYMPLPR